jgi:ABC-2 type transport system permease protein
VRLLAIVRREYVERVRTKAFLIGTLIGPLLLAGLTILPTALMSKQRGKPLRVAVLDASGVLRTTVEKALRERKVEGEARFVLESPGEGSADAVRAALRADVLSGRLDGYLFLPEDALDRSRAEYYGKNVSNVMDLGLMDSAVEDALVAFRLAAAGLPEGRIQDLLRRLDLKTIRLSESGEREDRGGSFLLSMILLLTLYTSVAMWGSALMNGVIEEKANRVVEIMVSSVSPVQLFAGKLLGVGAVGLTQLTAWAACAAALSFVGARAAGATGVQLPELQPVVLLFFVVFFLLGYFLYGAMYAAIGAAVNSQQEAQSLVFPVLMPLIFGVMLFPMVLSSPDSTLSTVLSMVPFWAPLLMFLRVSALMPPPWQLALSIGITLATIVVLNWGAARIYRVGILMYGKRPTLPELLKWVGKA